VGGCGSLRQLPEGSARFDLKETFWKWGEAAADLRPPPLREAAMTAKRVDAFIIKLGTIRSESAELAIKYRLPSSGPQVWPSAGGLIGYSGNPAEIYRLAADYVDKILKGRRPADLPVTLPTKFDLTVNQDRQRGRHRRATAAARES
jgi:hypothetical protein